MLQAVARECGTINYTIEFGGQCSEQATQKVTKLQTMKLRIGSCTMEGSVTQHSRKVTVGVKVHDLTSRRLLRGGGWQHLRQKYLKICHQNNIYYHKLGLTVGFEFKTPYKLRTLVQQRTLCALRIVSEICCLSPMNRSYWEDLVTSPAFAKFSELNHKFILEKILATQSCGNCEYWRCCL